MLDGVRRPSGRGRLRVLQRRDLHVAPGHQGGDPLDDLGVELGAGAAT